MAEEFKIYTGYFSKAKQYESKGLLAVSIARYPPSWFSAIFSYYDLAPTPDMFNLPNEQYQKRYESMLRYKSPAKVVEDLKKISGGIPVVLCCYEKPEEFCHRHLAAKWLSLTTGMDIVEHGINPPKSKPESPVCGSLF